MSFPSGTEFRGSSSIEWLCWQPTPYNNLLFRALGSDPRLHLTVHFIAPVLSTHPWQSITTSGFSARYFEKRCGLDWHLIRQATADRESLFVVAGWHDATMQLVSTILALRRHPFVLWTDTPNLGQRRNALKATARARWLRWIFSRAWKVMGTGCTALRALAEMGCPADKLVNLPYLVDIDSFVPGCHERSKSVTVYGSSGRLSGEKGYDLALQALATAYAGHPEAFLYRLAGIGPEQSRLERIAKDLGIEACVEFVGWLEPHSLPAFYATLDVFLHPARYEPYGVAILEAMASGTIIIGSDSTNVVIDRIQDGENGFVHRSGSASDLASKILEVRRRSEDLDRIRKAARTETEQWPASRAVNLIVSMAQAASMPAR